MERGRVIVPGGSGFIGRALTARLAGDGYEVIVVARRPADRAVAWDGRTVGPWAALLDGASAVVNLAGQTVACRWTAANRAAIAASRVDSTRAIGEAIARCARPPGAWIQASAIGFYGDRGSVSADEAAGPGCGFLADTCVAWERAVAEARTPGTRKVVLRVGVALGRGGGPLRPLARVARLGLGGRIGSGRQYVSWIHLDDLLSVVKWAIEDPGAAGVYNAVAPAPVTNTEFMRALRRATRRPWSPPVPAAMMRIGSAAVGIDPSLLLDSLRVEPARLQAAGFAWQFGRIEAALNDLLSPGRRARSDR